MIPQDFRPDIGRCPHCGSPLNALDRPDIDPAEMTIRRKDGTTAQLRQMEFLLLESLLEHSGRLVSRYALMNELYGNDENPPQPQIIGVHLSNLRRKIAGSRYRIETVNGYGLRLLEEKE